MKKLSGKNYHQIEDKTVNYNCISQNKNNRTPQYLLDLIPNSVGSRHNHNTRQVNNTLEINTRKINSQTISCRQL